MRKIITKTIAFIILLSLLGFGVMALFRSEYPYLWFVGLIVAILILIVFPYNKFFSN
ncbi:hypothetical protein [Capnocytophaga leadbetteri]|uniref:hypothetical protein n=1 Tax=Capnocytophaga leadbetteri TaxID=327575 RepID=UPI0028EC002B|nr:hypothetical protein [Capnocytophaga leadbetteri]